MVMSASKAEIIQTLRGRANLGDGEAAWILGDAYVYGHVGAKVRIRKNRSRALAWLSRAVALGQDGAAPELAGLLLESTDEKDVCLGLNILRNSAKSGNVIATQNLAMYYSDKGNPRRCFFWLLKTTLLGSPDWYHLAICRAAGYGCRRDVTMAKRFFRKTQKSSKSFPIDRERAKGFLRMIKRNEKITVIKSLGSTVPTN